MVPAISLTLFALLSVSVIHCSPIDQAVIGGPPAGIYGTNFTRSGPVGQGTTTFPKEADNNVTGDDILFQNLLAAEWIVEDL